MNDSLKPMSESEGEFANDSFVASVPIKPIENSDAYIKTDEKPVFENKEPENTVPLSSFIKEEPDNSNMNSVNTPQVETVVVEEEEVDDVPMEPEGNTFINPTNEPPVTTIPFINEQKEPVKKKSKINVILILAIIILLSFCAGKFGLNYFYTNDSHATVSTSIEFDEETKEVEISNLKFNVPKNLIVENWIEYLTIENDNQDFVARIEIHDYNFKEIYDNYTHLKADYTATYNGTPTLETYNEKEYVVVPYASGLSKKLAAFTKGTDEKMVVVILINKKNTYDYKMMEKLSEILNTVTKKK